ncbi:MAG TPA: M67 family metallopeptidase [Dehalococcoidia bacterium]|nr:M67 family metallopeptidase [Dehalococcoidia bacterium]
MIELDRGFVDDMFAHALEENPIECCGVVALDGTRSVKLYRAANSEASPFRYNVETKDLLRISREIDNNDWAYCIYHSHTGTEARPSPTDIRMAELWPEAYFVVISLAEDQAFANENGEARQGLVMRAFTIRDGEVREEGIRVVPGES